MAHVKAYTRTTKTGKTVMVKEHEDKRAKHEDIDDYMKPERRETAAVHHVEVHRETGKAKVVPHKGGNLHEVSAGHYIDSTHGSKDAAGAKAAKLNSTRDKHEATSLKHGGYRIGHKDGNAGKKIADKFDGWTIKDHEKARKYHDQKADETNSVHKMISHGYAAEAHEMAIEHLKSHAKG